MRRGFTLIEMLVALAITLVMMGAVVTLFGVISQSVSGSRAAIEMADRLRAARNQIQYDLQGVTATMKPPLRPENDEGYFEIIEGPKKDLDFSGISIGLFGAIVSQNLSLFGDVDDVLMFTTRSRGAPFTGKRNGVVIESPLAEVIYFLAPAAVDSSGISAPPVIDATTTPPTRLLTLYRRVLLVAPGVGPIPVNPHFYDANDISIRYETPAGTPTLIPNTLGDLTKRENRFAHYGDFDYGKFPFAVDLIGMPVIPPQFWPPAVPVKTNVNGWPQTRPDENAFLAPAIHARIGDDVLLTNVLAFDVQVFDPGAPIYVKDGVALEPSDPGWRPLASASGTPIGFGAYVDLGYLNNPITNAPNAAFNLINPNLINPNLINPNPTSGFASTPTDARVYDTWSLHYENDGRDAKGFPIDATHPGDRGTNGLDDGGIAGVVDDVAEYDTLPPYSAPLRGLRVRIRVYEPSSQVVREAIVVQSFLPE